MIQRAAIYDRALSAEEVAALAGTNGEYVSPEEIAAVLSPEERGRRQGLLDSIERDQKILATPKPRTYAVAPRPPEKTCLLVRGNTSQPAEEVSAGGVAGGLRGAGGF